jgi:Asp-tRNA(Asn)/Glu-tRNA(Gln) amidotransferase A subunit family amidase
MSESDLFDRLDAAEACFEALEPSIQAFLPEEGRFDRLRREAHSLVERYPRAGDRPPLFGRLVGVKDIFHVDGFPTRAGSRLPAAVLQGSEAECVSRLTRAGALVFGKTVTTEFAYSSPGPTRNPRNTAHTPGGSSSGSAAAVAAGLCELALGTQTIGSIVRPAAFCGVCGLKPTFDRISTQGVIPLSPSLDHVGCFAPDVQTAASAARVLCREWHEPPAPLGRPVLGVPEGPYLERASAGTGDWFTGVCAALAGAGFELRRIRTMLDYEEVCARHEIILSAEAARAHAAWFERYRDLYGSKIADLIRRGQAVDDDQLRAALRAREAFRAELRQARIDGGIDLWIAPSTTGPAPRGLASTGDPVMNLPWTQAGLPAVNLPAGTDVTGLPLGLQVVGDWYGDERLLAWAGAIEKVTSDDCSPDRAMT